MQRIDMRPGTDRITISTTMLNGGIITKEDTITHGITTEGTLSEWHSPRRPIHRPAVE